MGGLFQERNMDGTSIISFVADLEVREMNLFEFVDRIQSMSLQDARMEL